MTSFHSDPLEALRLGPGPRRPRRLRRTAALRDLVRETTLEPDDLVQPLFVVPGADVRRPVSSMPGVDQLSVDQLAGEAVELAALGVKAVLLFGVPDSKDPLGLESHIDDGVVQQAIAAAIPLGRIVQPADIGNACLFFCLPENGMVTGQALAVDGGTSTGGALESPKDAAYSGRPEA